MPTFCLDQQFHAPRTPVSLTSLNDHAEAHMLRAVLEHLRAVVTLHQPGTPGDFLLLLAQDQPPPYLLICGHGDENGLIFGEYAPDIDTSMLRGSSLPAQVIASQVALPGSIILSTACLSGLPEMGEAMLSGGARAYIAPDDFPNGADTGLFVLTLFHSLLRRQCPLQDAYARAVAADPEFQMFKLYTP